MNVGESETESEECSFDKIWERESQAVLLFEVTGAGTVVQAQDLLEEKWQVTNFSNTVWEAAIWMHHFFQDDRCFPAGWLHGRRVLELGAGTGLVGLTLALLGAEVTMTDLPEALPILRHNANATFGPSSTSDVSSCNSTSGNVAHDSSRSDNSPLTVEDTKRPTIRQLRWGSSDDAARVAAEAAQAAAAAAVAAGCQPSEWRGFDLIVGADIIYNEPTFPSLVETLSDRRLCSGETIVYLATMLRGGGHERLLDQLGEMFQVRALDPASADELRARVASSEDWADPEWKIRKSSQQRRTQIRSVRSSSDNQDSQERTQEAVSGVARTCNGSDNPSRGCAVISADATAGVGTPMGLGLNDTKMSSVVRRSNTKGYDHTCEWGYEADGLGKMLAFAARRHHGEQRKLDELIC